MLPASTTLGATIATVVVSVLVTAMGACLVGAGVVAILAAIGRRLPDDGFDRAAAANPPHKIGHRVRFTGFDPRPGLRHRRDELRREIRTLGIQRRHVEKRLRELERSTPENSAVSQPSQPTTVTPIRWRAS